MPQLKLYGGFDMTINERIGAMKENIAICKDGYYLVDGMVKCLSEQIIYMLNNVKTYTPQEANALLGEKDIKSSKVNEGCCVYELRNESVVDTIFDVANEGKVGVLNFASARHPGGGCLSGANAQEEVLCYSSLLYNALVNQPYYDINQKHGSCDYTDAFIYAKKVPFIRDSDGFLTFNSVNVDILTAPAVNKAVLSNKLDRLNIHQSYDVNTIMKNRMQIILSKFARECDTLILGAFGCGVFGNNPYDVAYLWRTLLIVKGYEKYFKRVIFSVYGKNANYIAFKKTWGF